MSIRKPAWLALLASILAAFAFNVQAEGENPEKATDVAAFEEIDTNADGMISAAEAQEKDSWVAGNFKTIDSNRDGYISKDELNKVTG
jgi:Ca2+-binding EF-hand superfamily protein